MNTLIDNLTKFITSVLDLYTPLPFQLSADLHTLNAYLRSYSEMEEKLLTNFVQRISDKLEQKVKKSSNKFNFNLDHLSNKENCIHQLNTENIHASLEKDPRNILKKQQIVVSKTTRDYHKHQTKNFNKKNEGLELTFKIQKHSSDNHENSSKNISYQLKSIKSEVEFPIKQISFLNSRNNSQDNLIKEKKLSNKNEINSKAMEKHRNNSSSSSLKIKLKPKTNHDHFKMRQNVKQLDELLSSNFNELEQLYHQAFFDQSNSEGESK